MNISDAITRWCEYRGKLVTLRLVAASTHSNQTQICARIMDGLGSLELADLRKSHIELWLGERLQTCAPVTVRGEMNVLRQILNWCVDEQMLVAKPRMPVLSVANVEYALPSDEAFLWVLAHVPPKHAAALEFMMLTGLSPHELERVQMQDVEDDTSSGSYLMIGKRPDFAVKQESRRRVIPLNGRAYGLWCENTSGAPDETRHPFPGVDAMQKAIRRAVDSRLVTIDGNSPAPSSAIHITPKLMRKWFASKVSEQQPEHILQRLMGHAPGSPITRRHYVRSTDEQSRDAVATVRVS